MPSDVQQIHLQVQLNSDDYARYFAIVGNHQSTWPDFAIYAGAFFLAIPAALAARALAALETDSPVAIELAGRFTLFAFFAGLLALTLASWIVRRRAIAKALSAIPNAYDAKPVLIDENGIALTGKLLQSRWTWPAISRVTAEQGLVLFWIGSQNAVVISDRAFSDSAARNNTIAFASARIAEVQP